MTSVILRQNAQLRSKVAGWKVAGQRVGVVPTMGALHAGHLSLVTAAKRDCDRVIVTIFVNPKQFNNPDDLQKYPKTEQSDAEKLRGMGVDVIYAPNLPEIYPDGFATYISVTGVSEGLCGAHRPGHFDGVATVVCKLLLQTGADVAFFGEKDFQQLQVVKRLVRDLDIACDIIGCATIREADGLALSSRNVRLDGAARAKAPGIYRCLQAAADALNDGGVIEVVLTQTKADLLAASIGDVEYLELRDSKTLRPVTELSGQARLLVAVNLGGVRLIDNIAVG